MKSKIKPGFWPTHSQKLLIKSALGEKESAINAWEEWRKFNELEKIDDGSYRLLPLVYKNIGEYLKDDSYWINLKEIYFNFWELNEKLANSTISVFSELYNNDITLTLLKGLPLVENYYIDSALRPMGDIDVFVPKEHFHRAIQILNDNGWNHSFQEDQIETITEYFHAVDFSNSSNNHLDLHWQIIPGFEQSNIITIPWKDSLNRYPVPINILPPTDELFHICIHGAQLNRIPSIRWIIDAYYILHKSRDSIDWVRLIELARKNSSILQIKEAFNLLTDLFGDLMPKEINLKLSKEEISCRQYLQFILISQPIPVVWGINDKLFYFNRLNKNNLNKLTQFIYYLKLSWGLKTKDNLYIFIFKMLFQRILLDVFTPPFFKRKHKELNIHNKKNK